VLAPDADHDAAIATIEQLYENGPQRVRATTEAEFQRQFVTMMGNVPTLLASIGGGVLFAIFFAVLNTMLMAGRERTRDIGILKALGFTNGAIGMLLLSESLLLCGAGGTVGALAAKAIERGLWSTFNAMIPGFAVANGVILQGIVLALALGVLAGALPSLRARRLPPVVALRVEV
jgi:putative ABC transport system permease protein